MKAKVTILGCGNSSGVPAIGNYWGACDASEPRNRRTRASIAVQSERTTLVIDTGADLREQMNRENIRNLDAVLYTHEHSDHIAGIDDLRGITLRNKKLTPIYGNSTTIRDLEKRFEYMFKGGKSSIYPPLLNPSVIADFDLPVTVGDLTFIPFEQDHGTCKTVGYRFGNFAYSVDMLSLDNTAVQALKGVKIWLVDSAGYHQANNKVHANFQTIFELNKTVKAEEVWLTNLSLAMDYKTLSDELSAGYKPAHDGLVLEIQA